MWYTVVNVRVKNTYTSTGITNCYVNSVSEEASRGYARGSVGHYRHDNFTEHLHIATFTSVHIILYNYVLNITQLHRSGNVDPVVYFLVMFMMYTIHCVALHKLHKLQELLLEQK